MDWYLVFIGTIAISYLYLIATTVHMAIWVCQTVYTIPIRPYKVYEFIGLRPSTRLNKTESDWALANLKKDLQSQEELFIYINQRNMAANKNVVWVCENGVIYKAEATPYQINFQDPATPTAERIIEIHHHVSFFLIVVLIFVSWMLYRILNTYWYAIPEGKKYNSSDLRKIALLSRLRFLHQTNIEVIWTCIPSLILVAIAVPSFGLLYAMDDVIDPEITLKVIGHQWYWSYEYSDYALEHGDICFDSYMLPETDLKLGQLRLLEVDNSVVLPLGVYVRLNITAADVLHSWAVPSLGIKIDAVPHRINSGIVFLERLGVFYGQCSEICGVNHGFMPISVKCVQINNYLRWLEHRIASK